MSLREKAISVLENNWKDYFTIPCEGLYPFQWFWDSGFIAIGWAHVDMERAKTEIRSLLNGQWKNGFIPHIVFHNKAETYFPGPEVHAANLSSNSPETPTSGITQPPVLGFVLERLYDITDEKTELLDYVNEVYDNIFRNHEYFYSKRDPEGEGLVYICHNWEAGTDNTPVWDFIWQTFEVPDYNLDRKDTKLIDASHRPTNKEYQYYIHLIELFKKWKYNDELIAQNSPFLIQDPLFNSLLIRSNEALIRLGKMISKDKEVSQLETWQAKAKARMTTKLYDKSINAYVYYDLRNNRKLSHASSSSFAPLFAGIPSTEVAAKMCDHLDGGRFSGLNNENYLCASFDPSSELFNSSKYWRGPIWMNLNWIIYKGLLRYNYNDLASEIREHSLYLMEKYGFYEYFEPSKKLNKSMKSGYGGNNFSWSAALTIDFLAKNS